MMFTPKSLQSRISCGEDSYTQFKSTINKSKDLAKEMVAFANSEGGIIIAGVSDTGSITGLTNDECEELGQLVGNVANENIRPPVHPITQSLRISKKLVIVITIPKGTNKPYATNSGDYLIKSGPDKKTISREELRRLFAGSSDVYPDEMTLEKTDLSDLNTELFYQFLSASNPDVYTRVKSGDLKLESILHNLELYRNQHLTLAGNLIFGKLPQSVSPSFYVDCAHINGDDLSSTQYVSKDYIKGTFAEIYKASLNFIKSSLHKSQNAMNFNSPGKLEVDENILIEVIVNSLVHRDYFINSSIKIFIFSSRIEVISPGKLTNSLTVEKILGGIAIHRNPILNSICKHVLPYSGYGSGIRRILSLNPNVEFVNDIQQEQFKVVIPRQRTLTASATPSSDPGAQHGSQSADQVTQSTDKTTQSSDSEKKITTQSTGKVTHSTDKTTQSIDPRMLKLTQCSDPVTKLLIVLEQAPLTSADCREILGLTHRQNFRDHYLNPAKESGYIELTIPEKPNSRLQQYRLTVKGRQQLAVISYES